jgi:hypothetical protein
MKVKVRIEFLGEDGKPVNVRPWETPVLCVSSPLLKTLRNALGSVIDAIVSMPSRFPQPPGNFVTRTRPDLGGPDTPEKVVA